MIKNIKLNTVVSFIIIVLLNSACSQISKTKEGTSSVDNSPYLVAQKHKPHSYGGWYCPDNLNGFPAVDIVNWKSVPVINGRLPTKEETQSEASLIFVDTEKYPKAKVLEMNMPQLAEFYNYNTKRKELVILIQALNISNDSVVGFRYLNGGNGSARLEDVKILSKAEINQILPSKFVRYSIKINASQDSIWRVLTDTSFLGTLKPTFTPSNVLKDPYWRDYTNVNYYNLNGLVIKAKYAALHYGSFYIQNDYQDFTEKFLLLENKERTQTELKILLGPFKNGFEAQENIIKKWSQKVKELSESM